MLDFFYNSSVAEFGLYFQGRPTYTLNFLNHTTKLLSSYKFTYGTRIAIRIWSNPVRVNDCQILCLNKAIVGG